MDVRQVIPFPDVPVEGVESGVSGLIPAPLNVFGDIWMVRGNQLVGLTDPIRVISDQSRGSVSASLLQFR